MKRFMFLLSVVPGSLMLGGCQSTIQLGGTYFPAWLLSTLLGVFLASIIHLILFKLGIDHFVQPRALAYPSMAIAFTLIIYLLFFR